MAIFSVGSLTQRLTSLDAFRGLTVASMILVNNPGDWGAIYPPLEHAAWSGWTFTDTIFPFFLWIVGVALTLSTAKRIEQGANREKLLAHVVRRSVLIFALGLFLAGFPYFHLTHIRIPGVLPRIAICYFIASLIFLYTKWRTQVASIVVLFALYWLLMMLVPLPCAATNRFDVNCNFARYVDGLLLSGHMWGQTKVWDPEGIVSTLPAIATTLFGVLTGTLLRQKFSSEKKAILLLGIGAGLFALAQLANIWMPINKSLWTVSFSLLMAGLASIEFAVLYWIIDIRELTYREYERSIETAETEPHRGRDSPPPLPLKPHPGSGRSVRPIINLQNLTSTTGGKRAGWALRRITYAISSQAWKSSPGRCTVGTW
jgi:predicted acyltransferase